MRIARLLILTLLVAATGCGKTPTAEPERRLVFARGGIVLHRDLAGEGKLTVTVDGGTTEVEGRPLGGERIFYAFSWRPARSHAISWPSPDGGRSEEVLIAPMRPEPVPVATVELESVHAGSVISGGSPDASLAFSADGSLLAVGTFGGHLRVYDVRTGRCVFEKRLPGAVVKRVALSGDNTRVYAGELSYDGFVRAYDLDTTEELWRFRLADDLETSRPARADDRFAIYSYPQVYCMRAVSGDLIVDGLHSWKQAGAPRHLSRIYRFDGRTGKILWRFPETGPLRRNIVWFDLDQRCVALLAHQWEKPAGDDAVPQNAVYLLDLNSGKRLDGHTFRPLEPFFTTAPMWYGVAFDDAGHLVVGLMDGRGAVFDTRTGGASSTPALRLVRDLDLATPVEVSGVPIYAGAGWAAGSGRTLYVMTDGRLTAPSGNAGSTGHADHPASNTIFALDGSTGKPLWQWKLTTTAGLLATGGDVLVASTQQSFSPDDPMDYGLTVFDTTKEGAPVEKLLYRYHTVGPVVALAVSPDGETIAAVEAPVKLPDGINVVGKHRLHVLH